MKGIIETVFPGMEESIRSDIQGILQKTIIIELEFQRPNLPGETEEEKYESFLTMLHDREYWEELVKAYPNIYCLLQERISANICFLDEIRERFTKDRPIIIRELFNGSDISDKIDHIDYLGDSHNGARRVALLTLTGGEQLIYKPYSLAADMQLKKLIHWVSDTIHVSYPWYQVIDRGEYGWNQVVTNEECCSVDEVGDYYYRIGILLFLTRILGSGDIHCENVIAHGACPVIIDAEMIIGNGILNDDEKAAWIEAYYKESVLRSGLLPDYIRGKDGGSIDISALSGNSGKAFPEKIPVVVNSGCADMRIEYKEMLMKAYANRCLFHGIHQKAVDYISNVLKGFNDCYQAVLSKKSELCEVVDSFSGARIRYLMRNTRTYRKYLDILWHPRYMENPGRREELLGILIRINKKTRIIDWQIKQESFAMNRGDIPVFWYYPEEKKLHGDMDIQENFFQESVLTTIKNRIKYLDESDRHFQEYLIYETLHREKKSDNYGLWIELKNVRETGVNNCTGNRAENRISAAGKIMDYVVEKTLISPTGEIGWIQKEYYDQEPGGWKFCPMGSYLYNGTAGILLALDKLIALNPKKNYTFVYEKLKTSLFESTQGRTWTGHLSTMNIGLYNGIASLAFLCQLLYQRCRDNVWLKQMRYFCDTAAEGIKQDRAYDILSGSAGALMAFLNAYYLSGEGRYLSYAEEAGGHLINTAKKYEFGWCWEGEMTKKGLTGMAHGNAGIMMALARLGKVTGKQKFIEGAAEAYKYEQVMYSPCRGDWLDIRQVDYPELTERIIKTSYPDIYEITKDMGGWHQNNTAVWCHGRGGILLARKKVKKWISAETKKDLNQSGLKCLGSENESQLQDNRWCLCHGKAGSYVINLILKENEKAEQYLSNILTAAGQVTSNQDGLPRIQESDNYGLFTGLSGIAYVLTANTDEMETLLTGWIE